MRRLVIAGIALFWLCLNLAPAAQNAAYANPPSPGNQPPPIVVPYSALEQTLKNSADLISGTQKNADAVVTVATKNAEIVGNVLTWGATLIGGLIVVFGWIGFQTRRDLKKMTKTVKREAKKQIAQKLNTIWENHSGELEKQARIAAQLAVDTAEALTRYNMFQGKPVDKDSGRALIGIIDDLEQQANDIQHTRIEAWAPAMRAIAYLRLGQLEPALKNALAAVKLNPKNWGDRPYNLACVYAALYARDQKPEHLNEACNAMNRALELEREQAADIASDDDLKAVREKQEFQAVLKKYAAP